MADYAIAITATVPVIAHVKDGRIFCNAPNGYVLTLVGADGSRRKIDESDGPVDKIFIFDVPPGAQLQLAANP